MLFLNSTFLIFCLLSLHVSSQWKLSEFFLFATYRFYHECVRFTQFDFLWIYYNTLNCVIVSLLVYRGASLQILKISRKTKLNQKSRDFCQMFVISKKKARTLEEIHRQDMDLKIYGKSIALPMDSILCDFHLWARSYKRILHQNSGLRRYWTPAHSTLSHCPNN